MSDFKSRLVEEKEQLDEKIVKLSEFTQSEAFSNIAPAQQSLLAMQLPVMSIYSSILDQRLSRL